MKKIKHIHNDPSIDCPACIEWIKSPLPKTMPKIINLFELPKVSNQEIEGIDMKVIKKVLTPSQYSTFNNWFAGKTGGITEDGKYFVYIWDWGKFLENELGLSKV